MRLGIDMDGVVVNFTQGWMDFYNREFGTSLRLEDAKEWNDLVDLTHFRNSDEFWAWSAELDGHSIFWHLEPFPGAVDALHNLESAGHEIVIITTKPRFAVDDTYEWLERYELPTAEVHILEKKWKVDCDVYLDDAPHVLLGLRAKRGDRAICRYVRPWNDPVDGVIDVHDFVEFRQVVDGLAKDPLELAKGP